MSRSRSSRRAAVVAFALAVCAPAFGADRDFDRRAVSAPAPTASQARALTRWRAAVPDLRFEIDPLTGGTRTVANAVGFLTGPRAAAAPGEAALAFVREELDLLGLAPEDLEGAEPTDSLRSAMTGITHLYFRQRLGGVPVYNGELQVHLADDGRILLVHNQFVPRLAAALAADEPRLAAAEAVAAAARSIGERVPQLAAPAEPRILPTAPGEARRVWNFRILTADGAHGYDFTVDAADGRVWTRFDWTADDSYRVYPLPIEGPTFVSPPPPADARTLDLDPYLPSESPFAWHDVDGVIGHEFTDTQGNNSTACLDAVAPLQQCDPGGLPDGGPGLAFDFPMDLSQPPSTYGAASVTQAFHTVNRLHDLSALYGFDSLAGNFQVNTYGQSGLGGDPLLVDVQDGSGTNGASITVPADGTSPRMQMFVWTLTSPGRDAIFDSGVVTHEFGHGISRRIVGGPANPSCLQNAEQPGEGISDWFTLAFTFDAAAPQPVRGIGTYIIGQPPDGQGIRTARYDSGPEPNGNPWSYASVQGSPIPHGVGEKWAQVAWMVQGALETAHGFEPDLEQLTGTNTDAGNVRALLYVMDGLKATVCSPGFVDVRDGMIAAANFNYGGEDVCTLWETFASYGLGFSAQQGSPNSINDQVPANDLPPSCEVPPDTMPFLDGFESGDTSAWSSTVP